MMRRWQNPSSLAARKTDGSLAAPASVPIIQLTGSGSLREHIVRQRPQGPIGGVVHWSPRESSDEPAARAARRLRNCLGENSQLLDEHTPLVFDSDCCQLDGQPLLTAEAWRSSLQTARIADISGAFAVAWQSPDGTLTLARDAIGQRTLFYARTSNGVVFASKLSAILTTGLIDGAINASAVATYLTYAYLPGRETLIDGVLELLPGECVQLRSSGVDSQLFWEPPREPADWQSEDALRAVLRGELERAVNDSLPAGEAVGAFLSGGLDSSLVVALARRLHDAPVRTFSVSFGPDYANELPFSTRVAQHCGTEHQIVELSPQAVLHHLDDTIAMLSDPIGDPLTVPNALLFRTAAESVGVVLNGEGGDPCFGGPKNLPMLLSELYRDLDDSRWTRERAYLRAHLKCYDDLDLLLTDDVRTASADDRLEQQVAARLSDPRWQGFVTRLQAINVVYKGGHHILPKVDALSGPFGILPRSPLFDRTIVELSFAIPPQLKLRGSVEKFLLKQAVRDLLPAEIIDRPKSGMLVPVEGWFRGPLLPAARERLLDGLAPWGLFRREYLERLLAGRLGGLRPRHGAKIWLLVTLEAWLRGVASQRVASA